MDCERVKQLCERIAAAAEDCAREVRRKQFAGDDVWQVMNDIIADAQDCQTVADDGGAQ